MTLVFNLNIGVHEYYCNVLVLDILTQTFLLILLFINILRACCSQSEFRILKIRKSSASALVLYNNTANTLRACFRGVRSVHACVELINNGVFTLHSILMLVQYTHTSACPVHSHFRFVHLTHQSLSARALFCLNSLAKVNTQLLIYNWCDPSHPKEKPSTINWYCWKTGKGIKVKRVSKIWWVIMSTTNTTPIHIL